MAEAIVVLNAGSSSLKSLCSRGATAGSSRSCAATSKTSTPRRVLWARTQRNAARGTSWGKARGSVTMGRSNTEWHSCDRASPSTGYVVWVTVSCMAGSTTHSPFVRCDDPGDLERLMPLAPLHQAHNLAPIRALLERSPLLSQVACFDTAFHSGAPAVTSIRAAEGDHRAWCAPVWLSWFSYDTSRMFCRDSTLAPRVEEPSCCTLVTARACVRSTTAAALRRRWVSQLRTGCPWARGAGASIPARFFFSR